jgi:hypothetical protein
LPGPEEEVDRLFALPLDEFTAARNTLARALKETDGAAAEQVRTLAKPSVPAWAINQLARSEPGAVGALLDAGAAMRSAQERALGGSGAPDELRSAQAQERAAIDTLTQRAQALLAEAGRPATQSMLDRIARTLHTAAVDDEGRRLLQAGRLTEELEPAGFEALAGLTVPAAGPGRDDLAERRRRKEEEQRRKLELEHQARELDRQAREAEREADTARAAAVAAERRAERARSAADKAAAELDDA